MITRRDPDAMTPAERLAEVAAILATGYRRHCLHAQNARPGQDNLLAESRVGTASCDRLHTPENEVA